MNERTPDNQPRPFLMTEAEALALVLWFDDAEMTRHQYAWEYELRDRLREFAVGKRTAPAKPCRW